MNFDSQRNAFGATNKDSMRSPSSRKLAVPEKKWHEKPLNIKEDPDRPHEDAARVDRGFIEMSIEKKRQRVNIEAIHKAQVSHKYTRNLVRLLWIRKQSKTRTCST